MNQLWLSLTIIYQKGLVMCTRIDTDWFKSNKFNWLNDTKDTYDWINEFQKESQVDSSKSKILSIVIYVKWAPKQNK